MVQKKKQLAHLFDATQCISCGACILACSQTNFPEMHNKSIPGRNWPASNIRIFRSEERSPVNLLVQCQQCENAPCVKTCPFGANYYDENGLVRNDPDKCVGCKLSVRRSLEPSYYRSADEMHQPGLYGNDQGGQAAGLCPGLSCGSSSVRRYFGSSV